MGSSYVRLLPQPYKLKNKPGLVIRKNGKASVETTLRKNVENIFAYYTSLSSLPCWVVPPSKASSPAGGPARFCCLHSKVRQLAALACLGLMTPAAPGEPAWALVRAHSFVPFRPRPRRASAFAHRRSLPLLQVFYDDDGNETERVTLDANAEPSCLNVERDRWHSLVCLEQGSVLFEAKDGAYAPLGEGEVMQS